jgi:hypothetical protein
VRIRENIYIPKRPLEKRKKYLIQYVTPDILYIISISGDKNSGKIF